MPSKRKRFSAWLLLVLATQAGAQTVVNRGDELTLDVSVAREEIVFDLLGDLWRVPVRGGPATRLAETRGDAKRPRWSPDGSQVAYEEQSGNRAFIIVVDALTGETRRLTDAGREERRPAWHPSGDRLVFSARQRGTGADLREVDLATGLEWRLTDDVGDETDPAWSADGRDLAYIAHVDEGWALMLREFGQPARTLVRSEAPLAAPSWRPDGTLITYFREQDGRQTLRMLILSEPPLDRVVSEMRSLFPEPVAWLDRSRMFYSGNQSIRTREFDDWNGRGLAFRASIAPVRSAPPETETQPFIVAKRSIDAIEPPTDLLVVRAGRLFDGQSRRYRAGVDVLIEKGVIADVTASRDWDGLPVIDLPGTTLLPGFIDVNAATPARALAEGAQVLSWGVTTLVASEPESLDVHDWHADTFPGPRLLPAGTLSLEPPQTVDAAPFLVIATGADGAPADRDLAERWQTLGVPVLAADWVTAEALDTVMLPAAVLPADSRRADDDRPAQPTALAQRRLLSSLADRHTPGIERLLGARQLQGRNVSLPPVTRVPLFSDLRRSRAPLIVSSAANDLPPGVAVHAEFLAMQAAGLSGEAILKAAGRDAANALGLGGQLGEITVGAMADLVLVNGDPLTDIADARNIVGVVRNGRFFSLVSLLERIESSVGKFDNNENVASVRVSQPKAGTNIGPE